MSRAHTTPETPLGARAQSNLIERKRALTSGRGNLSTRSIGRAGAASERGPQSHKVGPSSHKLTWRHVLGPLTNGSCPGCATTSTSTTRATAEKRSGQKWSRERGQFITGQLNFHLRLHCARRRGRRAHKAAPAPAWACAQLPFDRVEEARAPIVAAALWNGNNLNLAPSLRHHQFRPNCAGPLTWTGERRLVSPHIFPSGRWRRCVAHPEAPPSHSIQLDERRGSRIIRQLIEAIR